jgi:hypothetical protein
MVRPPATLGNMRELVVHQLMPAWDSGRLPQYLEERFSMSAATHQPIKLGSNIPMESTNAIAAQ